LIFVFLETGSCYIVQANIKLTIFLPQLPDCWVYQCEPSHPTLKFHFHTLVYLLGQEHDAQTDHRRDYAHNIKRTVLSNILCTLFHSFR
jgi:hypothetical protein